ncbi:MAG: response regulator [Defluviitaleaceae bacterium]|nr:response regulator [Defluviitaleaceae bacterium]
MERKKIIYLDDVYHSLVTVVNKVKDHYELYPVQTTEKMFEILERVEISLILLDINMPEESGFDVLKKLKEDPKYAHIPIIFITARRDKETIKEGLKLGATDFISKPASESEIVERIEYTLNPEKRSLDKPVILAIDDDASMLHSLSALLGKKYTMYTMPGVSNEKILKELLKKISPDLFILDCNMPGINGFDLVPIIKSIRQHEDTPIIFLTSDGRSDTVFVAMNKHAADFLVKPVDTGALYKKLETHLKDYMVWRHIRTEKKY